MGWVHSRWHSRHRPIQHGISVKCAAVTYTRSVVPSSKPIRSRKLPPEEHDPEELGLTLHHYPPWPNCAFASGAATEATSTLLPECYQPPEALHGDEFASNPSCSAGAYLPSPLHARQLLLRIRRPKLWHLLGLDNTYADDFLRGPHYRYSVDEKGGIQDMVQHKLRHVPRTFQYAYTSATSASTPASADDPAAHSAAAVPDQQQQQSMAQPGLPALSGNSGEMPAHAATPQHGLMGSPRTGRYLSEKSDPSVQTLDQALGQLAGQAGVAWEALDKQRTKGTGNAGKGAGTGAAAGQPAAGGGGQLTVGQLVMTGTPADGASTAGGWLGAAAAELQPEAVKEASVAASGWLYSRHQPSSKELAYEGDTSGRSPATGQLAGLPGGRPAEAASRALRAYPYCIGPNDVFAALWELNLTQQVVFTDNLEAADLVLHRKPRPGEKQFAYDRLRAAAKRRGIPFVTVADGSAAELEASLMPVFGLYRGQLSVKELRRTYGVDGVGKHKRRIRL